MVGCADVDEKRFRLAATVYLTAAGKVVRIHPQACHLLRLQAAAVNRQQIRSFMSKSSAKRFLKRISKVATLSYRRWLAVWVSVYMSSSVSVCVCLSLLVSRCLPLSGFLRLRLCLA